MALATSTKLTVALTILALSSCRCQEDDLGDLKPKAAVDPNPIAFELRRVDADTRMTVKLMNVGTADMDVSRIAIEPADAPFTVVQVPGKEIIHVAEGQLEPFEVVFHPPARGPYTANLVVETNDPDTPKLQVPITGVGGPPRIKVNPEAVTFDLVHQGNPSSRTFTIENTGLDVLHVTDITIDPSSDPGFGLAVTDSFPRGDVGVGERVTVKVEMFPQETGDAEGLLHILSDADGEPDKAVPLTARANLAPAVKVVEKVTRVSDYRTDLYLDVVLDASETVEPEGENYTLSWRMLERPLGSQSILEQTGVDVERQLYIDQVGIYRVEVTGTDSRGATAKGEAIIRAVRDLALRLTWQPAPNAPCRSASTPEYECGKTDVDLHLVAPGGTLGDYFAGCAGQAGCDDRCRPTQSGAVCRSQGLDCSYANRNPDWGTLTDVDDDPRQDIDDVRGEGPEIISLNNPVEGDYVVQVHFCNDRLEDEGAVAQVEVFFHGEPAPVPVLGPVQLPTEGSLWLAGIVHYNPNASPRFTMTDFNASPAIVDGPADLCTQ
ncbi:MAG: choice-of-anchor D domain-containing protein [Myxococcota bacterium]